MGQSTLMMIVIGILAITVGIFYLYTKKKESNTSDTTNQKQTNENTSMQGVKRNEKAAPQHDMSGFIKFDKIANDMIYQNNGERYSMVIQCKGINYNLMSEIEQMAVEEGFIMFLNTLKFPIQLYVQTRSIDLNDNVRRYKERVKQFVDKQNEVSARYNELEDDIDATKEEIEAAKKEKLKYSNIAEYVSDITRYVERMALNKYMLQRNFYIVLSYNKSELATTEKFTKEEYEDLCYRELYTRAQGIIGSLVSCSVNCNILNSNELAQLVYVSFNKDDANTMNIKDALESGIFRLYTSSEDAMKKKREMLEEELNRQSRERVEEAVQKAIERGLIVTEEESEEEVRKEIDKRAIKIIDKSAVDEKVKQGLKDIIKEERRERVQAINEKKAKLKAEKANEEAAQVQTDVETQENAGNENVSVNSEEVIKPENDGVSLKDDDDFIIGSASEQKKEDALDEQE